MNTVNTHVRLCVIYGPPHYRQNGHKMFEFFKEWSSYLDRLTSIAGHYYWGLKHPKRRFAKFLRDLGLVYHMVERFMPMATH